MNPVFRQNPYAIEIESVVTRASLHAGCTALVPRDLLLFPPGGGQCGDQGWITLRGSSYPVREFVKDRGDVLLVLDRCVPDHDTIHRGEPILQAVDWQARYRAMRLHSAQHALGAAARLTLQGYSTRGMQISGDAAFCSMRFLASAGVTDRNLDSIQSLVAAATESALALTAKTFDSLLEAQGVFGEVLRVDTRLPAFKGRVRVVVIGDPGRDSDPICDASPCGGTHVRSMEEIPPLQILNFFRIDATEDWEIQFALGDPPAG